jgi:N-acetylmuramoyl-L-alanine amidase
MLLLRENRLTALLISILFLLLCCAACASADDKLSLWYGEIKKGDITTRVNSSGVQEAAVDEIASALGLMRSGEVKGLVFTLDGKKIEFWDGASAARVNGGIIPLASEVSISGGAWWADARASLSAFDRFYASIGKTQGLFFLPVGESPTPEAIKKAKKSAPAPMPVPAPVKKPPVYKPPVEKPPVAVQSEKPKPAPAEKPKPAPAPEPAPAPKQPAQPAAPFTGKKPIVVLDAGHGGRDPGACANGVREKDINLKAVLELGPMLEKYGVEVRYSRKTDVYLKLAERTAFANKNNANVFISLHCNAMPKGKHAAGLEYYIMALPSDKDAMRLAVYENKEISGGDPAKAQANADKKTKLLLKILGDMQQNDKINESTALAEVLHKNAKSAGLPMRKVGQAPFFVLRGAAMPAVLVEMGYLTDKSEAKKLSTKSYRASILSSIAAGVVQYIKEHPVNTR